MENTLSKGLIIISSILIIGLVVFGTLYNSIDSKGDDIGTTITNTNVTTPSPSPSTP